MDKMKMIDSLISKYQRLMDESAQEVRAEVKSLKEYTSSQDDALPFIYEVESAIRRVQHSLDSYKLMRTRQNELTNIKKLLDND